MEQLSIFLENRAGRLETALATLASRNCDIRALSLADTSDFGILRIIVDQLDTAEELLRNAGFTVGRTFVIALDMPDVPGALLDIVRLLASRDINIEYMYPCASKKPGRIGMVFRFDKMEWAREILEKNGQNVTSSPP